ncbi:phosphotriesterase-related protein [Proteinivorax hydrogeniformans]|uniref:Phosphotriesterase-related protein n=1 Tax=Proteinivorax hydrogeniformans TaxID=1826727 RepID=A0AAU8HQQ8_9FIRM
MIITVIMIWDLLDKGEDKMVIQTVDGAICEDRLGKTYIHEHLKIDLSKHKGSDDTNFNDLEAVIEEMKTLKSKGVNSIVEVTNRGMGQDIAAMQKVSRQCQLNIIASTGFYKEPYLPDYFYTMTEKELAKLLVKDILEGIDKTGVKAHVIGEVGTGKENISDEEAKIFGIAIAAHLETGRPISTHTTLGNLALQQLKILSDSQVDLQKVVIGHLDLNCDKDYHLRVADSGCYMAFDTIGKTSYQLDGKRAEHIKILIDRGHVNQIMLSQDITRKSHLQSRGGIGYNYLMDTFVPMLREVGVRETEIDQMLIDNPKRFLAI